MQKKLDYTQYSSRSEYLHDMQEAGLAKTWAEAFQIACVEIPREKHFQTKILRYLKGIKGAFVWKTQGGSYQRTGLPDICCIVGGQFFGFEVKRPLLGQATSLQEQVIREIKKAGGHAYIVSYVHEVEEILKSVVNL